MFKRSLLYFNNKFKLNCSYVISTRTLNYSTKDVKNILESGKIGEYVEVKGWVKALRKQKENIFIDVSDGSTAKKLQVLVSQQDKPEKLSYGASIIASGRLTATPKGAIELSAEKATVCGECDLNEGFPFAPRKQYAQEYIRKYLHLRPKTNKFASLLRLRHTTNQVINTYLSENGYINIHTPILTSNDCEGAGEVFKVMPDSENLLKSLIKEGYTLDEAYFDRKVYLTVSGQLHLEAAAHSLNKVYTFGPTFRAENSKTRLHLSEFYMLEAEIAFLEKIDDLIRIIEDLIKNITKEVLRTSENDIKLFKDETNLDFSWLDKDFVSVTYEEATQILQNKYEQKIDNSQGFSKEQELLLVKNFENVPVFLINWPKSIKPFYMRECQSDNTKVSALDLLVPQIGEIVGGSLRENSYDKLKTSLPNSLQNSLNWYLELRKFGGVPTGGFGLGFERYLCFLLGINNVKDCIPFPRWPHNCDL